MALEPEFGSCFQDLASYVTLDELVSICMVLNERKRIV